MKRVGLVLLLACAFFVAAAGAVFAEEPLYTENSECFECHGADLGGPATKKVDFGVGAVNKETACVKCHWQPRHFYHKNNAEGCNCHSTFPRDRLDLYFALNSTPYGYFTLPDSPSASAKELHEIHANGSWAAEIVQSATGTMNSMPACASCHAPASCAACHEGVTAHGGHGSADPAYPPVDRRVAVGASASQPLADTTIVEASSCVNDSCHPSTAAATARFETVYSHKTMAYTGTYTIYNNAALLQAGAQATVNVSGAGDIFVYTYGMVDTGILQVNVDSDQPVFIDTSILDTYLSPVYMQNIPFRVAKGLPSGTHTVTITATGLRNPLSSGTSVYLMSVRLTSRGPLQGFVPTCTSCHDTKAAAHGYDTVDHVADDAALSGVACSACHALDLSTEHEKSTSSSSSLDCGACHPAPRNTFAAWDQTCVTGGCHTQTSSAPMHSTAATAHAVLAVGEVCLGCHEGVDLESIHTSATVEPTGATSCFVCHGGTEAPSTSDCTDPRCHFSFDEHYDSGAHTSTWTLENCNTAGCHSTRDLMGAHTEKNGTFTCGGCHDSELPAVVLAIKDGITACGACHTGVTETSGHYAIHMASPPLQDASGPNYGYWTGSASTQPTGDCAGCHTSNLVDEHLGELSAVPGVWKIQPRYDSTGDILTCATCHNSLDASVQTAITLGFTKCDGCHVVHGPLNQVHTSSFATSQEVDCSGCHSSVLSDEHDGGYTTITPSGMALTGCDVCHKNFEAPRGPVVQAAISVDNTTLCAACHGTTHPDLGSHAATEPASLACAACHGTGSEAAVDIKAVHAEAELGTCAVCHSNPARVPSIASETGECASCHAAEGTDFHRGLPVAHTYNGMDSSCASPSCHGSNTLPEVHEAYLAEEPAYATTCALCHLNADPDRIDWTTASADCSTCHTVHGDIATIHQAPNSTACVECHETADVRDIHPACATCHNATVDTSGDTACTNMACHGGEYPVPDPNHYDAAKHAADEAACGRCHFMDMKAEHFKSTVAVTCVQCHETKVDDFTSPWDKTCAACHPTKHGDQNTKHVSANTSCSGMGCHDITDAADIHRGLSGGGCFACHKSASQSATTTNCTASGCHSDVGTDHHAAHDGQVANGAGCEGCHFRYLDDEHAALGLTCATCHASADAMVEAAIAAGDVKCLTCHADSAHNARQAVEFGAGNASLHRVSEALPGMRSSFVVNGATYTWSLPTASSFLKTGYTTSSMMTCASCHTYSGSTGPHGAAMKVNIDPAYPNSFKIVSGSSTIAQLSNASASGMSSRDGGSTPAGVICEKCHDLLSGSSTWSNVVHKEHDDRGNEGGYCNFCHTSIPHGWGRPRLIGYTTDDAAHRTYTGGIQRLSLKNYTPSGWDKSDCGAGCSSGRHPLSGSSWPNVMSMVPGATTGNVSGKVTVSGSTTAVSGATVKVGTQTATTGTDGAYSITGLAAGTYTITVSKVGYVDYRASVVVSAGATASHDVSLSALAGDDNLALGKVFTASRYESYTYSASKAGDGNSSSYWWSDNNGDDSDRESLSVDLGSTYSVSRIEVEWFGSYWASEYRLYVSVDGRYWSQAYATYSAQSGTNSVAFSARNARYVRLECRQTGTGRDNGYGVAELRVYR